MDFKDQSNEASDISKASDKEETDASNAEENIDKLALGRTMRQPTEPFPVRAPLKPKKDLLVKALDKETQVSPELILRCEHCKVSFDDEIIFAIHSGWHNHANPFTCNMSGENAQAGIFSILT